MQKFAGLLLLFWAVACPAAESGISKADEAFKLKRYEQALKGYEEVLKKQPGDERSIYRAATCEGMLFRYAEAAQRLAAFKTPAGGKWQMRFLLLKAELGREFLKQYSHGLSRDQEEGTEDVTRKTANQWRKEIRASFAELWKMRDRLLGYKLADESEYVDTDKSDLELAPTLLDFVVLRWTGYIGDEEEADDGSLRKPDPGVFLVQKFQTEVQEKAVRALKLGQIYEHAAEMPQRGRELAAELWRLRRLEIPFVEGDLVRQPDAPAEQKAQRVKAEGILESWFEKFGQPRSRALAGYRAATLLNQDEAFEAAVRLCRRVEKSARGTQGAELCGELRGGIELPRLELTAYPVPPGGKRAFSLNVRNIEDTYLRAYPTTASELQQLGMKYRGGATERDYAHLRWMHQDVVKTMLGRTPIKSWDVKTHPEKPYGYVQKFSDFPEAKPGLYIIVASNEKQMKPGSSMLKAAIANVTGLFLVGTAGQAGLPSEHEGGSSRAKTMRFEVYAMDGETGKPASKAKIEALWSDYNTNEKLQAMADSDGHAGFSVPVRGQHQSQQLDPLASREQDFSFLASPLSGYYQRPERVQLHLETDRPIYRPGQKVQIKMTALELVPRGYKAYRGPSTILLQVMDANYQEFFQKNLKPNAYGSASVEVVIPPGRLLGSYSVSATVTDGGEPYSAGQQFQVEEYKRPEFEVELEAPAGAWKFGQKAQIKGSAKYYFGGAVPEAPVSYRIFRQTYIPWFCWWWRGMNFDSARKEVASGQVKTHADGKFEFEFVPEQDNVNEDVDFPSTFSVEVDARDTGGRTISTSRDYRAGKHALLFSVPMDAGFFREGKLVELKPSLLDLNEQPATSEGSYELFAIDGQPKKDPEEWRFPGLKKEPSLEAVFSDVPNGAKVRSGSLKYKGASGAELSLSGLREGLYRLELKATDPWGGAVKQGILLVVADTARARTKLQLPGVTLVEHKSYVPGESAKILMGSNLLSGAEYVEIWGGRFLLNRKTLNEGGATLVDFEVNDEWKGGASVRWFGAGSYFLRGGQAEIAVPWKDKELKADLNYAKVLKPSERVDWEVTAKDPNGKGVDAEATVRVFDRSLEYYIKGAASWVQGIYPNRWLESGETVSMAQVGVTEIAVETGWIKQILELFGKRTRELKPPALLVNRTRVYPRRSRMHQEEESMRSSVADMEAAPPPMSMPKGEAKLAAEGAVDKLEALKAPLEKANGGGRDSEPNQAQAPDIRSNFSETAHFDPALKLSKGSARIRFQVPEQLTSWKIDASVLTADAKWGYATGTSVTRKDLMVRVEMPRFFRESDQGVLKASVHNETDKKFSGKLTLAILPEGAKTPPAGAAALLGVQGALEKSFDTAPHGVTTLSWPIAVPAGVRNFKIRAIARSGELVDAEERDLPILPSRQRLIESQLLVLDGDATQKLTLPSVRKADPSRQNELMELRVDPNLALSILNSLPFLIQYPYECTEQVLNRFVPAGIVSAFYEKYPAIAEAAKKVPKRTTVVPAWEQNDERRLTTLMETPWVIQSKGGYEPDHLIDMLDPKVVRSHRDSALARLKSYQLGNGGFPWFPGGHADPYITLLVLAGLAEAERYGIEAPADMRDRALGYVFGEIPQHLKPEEGHVALVLYAAFVTTSFEKGRTAEAREFAKAWIAYAVKHEDAMTPLGHGYAAHVYWRLGEKAKGDAQLERALEGSREDPIAGLYWTPEKISWLWYSDTLEKHAFFLRTLLQQKPKDPRIPGMVKWVLFNRKGNEWKSTKAAAAAIYSLLDVMKTRGSLDRGDQFTVKWPGSRPIQETVKVGPTDWLAKPLSWKKRELEIQPRAAEEISTPEVIKKGPGYAFASLTWIFSTDELPKESVSSGLIGVARRFFRRVKEGTEYHLKPLDLGGSVAVGDELEVHLTVNTKSQFEYVHLKDPKPAGFEAETLLSGWKWDQLGRYEEPRDSLTNFFMSWVPHGEYVLRYRLRATTPGSYRVGPAVLQSMYAPEMTGYSSGFRVNVQGD